MLTARAKGLAEWVVIAKHALKNSAIPIVTLAGLDTGQLLGGAVITETIFAWPGLGRLTVQALLNRDFPVVLAAVFIFSVTYTLINLVVDLLYGWLDPRTRRGRPARDTKRFIRRHGRGVLGLIIAALVVVAAVAAPVLVAQDPLRSDFALGLKPPGTPGPPLGTDQLGRDLLARVLTGPASRSSSGSAACSLTAVVGGLRGLLAGYYEGWPARWSCGWPTCSSPFRSSCSRSPSTRSWGSGCATSS